MQVSSLTPSTFPGISLAQWASLLGMLLVLASRSDGRELKIICSALLSIGYSFISHQQPYCPCPHRPDPQPVSCSTRQLVWSRSCTLERCQPPRQSTLVGGTTKFHVCEKFTWHYRKLSNQQNRSQSPVQRCTPKNYCVLTVIWGFKKCAQLLS